MDSKEIIIQILQKTLIGQLKSESTFNPQHVASAIEDKLKFNQSSEERFNREILDEIIKSINEAKKENEIEFSSLDQEKEKLLINFIRGKIHAYEEFLDILKKL